MMRTVYARAGMSWHGVANSVGCDACNIRIAKYRKGGQSDGALVEELMVQHRKNAVIPKCEWGRLDAGWNSETVRAAMKEWNKESLTPDDEDWAYGQLINRHTLSLLNRVQLEVEAIIDDLTKDFDGKLEPDETKSPKTLTPYHLRDLKTVNQELRDVVENCCEGVDLANPSYMRVGRRPPAPTEPRW